jgi:hypothetical protein
VVAERTAGIRTRAPTRSRRSSTAPSRSRRRMSSILASIEQVRAQLHVSERRACAALGQHRSTQRKVPRGHEDEERLTADIIELARQYGRYGYRKIAERYRRTFQSPFACYPLRATASFILDAALCYVMVSEGVTYAPVIPQNLTLFLLGYVLDHSFRHRSTASWMWH